MDFPPVNKFLESSGHLSFSSTAAFQKILDDAVSVVLSDRACRVSGCLTKLAVCGVRSDIQASRD